MTYSNLFDIQKNITDLKNHFIAKDLVTDDHLSEFYDKVYSITEKLTEYEEDSFKIEIWYEKDIQGDQSLDKDQDSEPDSTKIVYEEDDEDSEVPALYDEELTTTDQDLFSVLKPSDSFENLDFLDKMSKDSRKCFMTAEKVYKILVDDDIDWVVVLAPYSKAIEIELFNRIIRKFEAWNNSKGYKLNEIDEKIRNYSKITIGQLLFLLRLEQFKEFINESFNKNTVSFLSSRFRDQLRSLNNLRNPFIHKKTAGYEIVESFRKIMIDDGFMMNLIQIS